VELLFVALGGAIIGLAARYFLPHRHTHGAVLIPALGVMVSSALWVALTWAGLKWNGGWIWWITLVGTAVIVAVADIVIGRVRTAQDDRLLADLSKGAVAR
jgi:ABC-type branched-subunit amino acid transport system permease subunit